MKPKTRLTTQPLRFFLLVPALALVLVGTGQAGSSEPSAPRTAVHLAATQVQCGDMITTDTRLSRDLNNCPADAVIIGAPRVRWISTATRSTVWAPGSVSTRRRRQQGQRQRQRRSVHERPLLVGSSTTKWRTPLHERGSPEN